MNARALANDVTSAYLSTVDVHSSHATNVRDHLRESVLDWTRKILYPPPVNDNNTNNNGVVGGGAAGLEVEMEFEEEEGGDAAAVSAVAVAAPKEDEIPVPPVSMVSGTSSTFSSLKLVSEEEEKESSSEGEVSGKDDGEGKDWRDYLYNNNHSSSGSVESSGGGDDQPKLGRRANARMEAFLGLCALALPDDPLPPPVVKKGGGGRGRDVGNTFTQSMPPPAQPKSRRSLSAQSSGSESSSREQTKSLKALAGGDISLSTALSGFVVGGGNTTNGSKNDDTGDGAANNNSNNNTKKFPPVPSPTNPILRSISSTSTSSSIQNRRPQPTYPQIHHTDLQTRLELYFRTVKRVRDTNEECVVHLEPTRAVKARVQLLIRSFVSTVGCVRSISPVLTNLLGFWTRELLGVEVLGEEIQVSIGRLVSEYEHLTSFASLAFLSSPEESAESHLTPLLTHYVQYLQSDYRNLVSGCELERMLCTVIDPTVRHLFQTIEFRSIGHLLDVCHEYREELQSIMLPPQSWMDDTTSSAGGGGKGGEYGRRRRDGDDDDNNGTDGIDVRCHDPKAVRQALRDLRREIITVNGHVLPPAHSLKELARLLTQTLNSRTLTLSYGKGSGSDKKNRRKGVKKSSSSSGSGGLGPKRKSCPAVATVHMDNAKSATSESELSSSDFVSSGNEGDTDGTYESEVSSSRGASRGGVKTEQDDDKGNNNKTGATTTGEGVGVGPRRILQRRPSIDLETIDFMTRRLLIASSRTGTGGDAFFVVRDLFGGDEVEVIPSRSQPTYSSSQPSMYNRLPHQSSSNNSSSAVRGNGGGTIELIVRLASVTIKCHGRYDVYPKPISDDDCEPLIQLHTTTTETIALQEVRACDDDNDVEKKKMMKNGASGGGGSSNGGSDKVKTARGTKLMLKERKTDATGWRTLSIRPAHYEKVGVWNTPS